MKIHYQAKQIFQKHGIRTPHGVVIQDAGEIEEKINSLDTPI